MLKERNKLFFIIVATLAMVISFGFSSHAASSSSPKDTLENALQKVVERDIDSYVNYVIDDSFNTLEQQKIEYAKEFSKNPLDKFNILKSNAITKNKSKVTVKFFFENGEITETQLLMKKVNNEWKLLIKDLKPKENKTIKKGKKDLNPKENGGEFSTQGVSICNWYFSDRLDGSTFYSNSTFTPPSSALIIGISHQVVSSGPPSVSSPRIQYAVVNKNWYGDTVYGTRTVYGDSVYNSRYSISIDSSAVGDSGLQVRFKPDSSSSYVKWDGNGSLEY